MLKAIDFARVYGCVVICFIEGHNWGTKGTWRILHEAPDGAVYLRHRVCLRCLESEGVKRLDAQGKEVGDYGPVNNGDKS